MSFSTMKEPCKEGCRPYSPLKIVNHIKYGARGAAYLCKVDIAARSPFGRPPARRVGIACPCAAAVVCRAARGCTVPPWGVPCRPWVYRAARGCTVPPWGVPCRRGVCPARAPRWREHQRRSPHSPLVGLDRCFRGLTGSRAEVERAPAQVAYSP